jgi:hypothetical protein
MTATNITNTGLVTTNMTATNITNTGLVTTNMTATNVTNTGLSVTTLRSTNEITTNSTISNLNTGTVKMTSLNNASGLPLTITGPGMYSFVGSFTAINTFQNIFDAVDQANYFCFGRIGTADSVNASNFSFQIYRNGSVLTDFWISPASRPTWYTTSGTNIQLKDPGAYQAIGISVLMT